MDRPDAGFPWRGFTKSWRGGEARGRGGRALRISSISWISGRPAYGWRASMGGRDSTTTAGSDGRRRSTTRPEKRSRRSSSWICRPTLHGSDAGCVGSADLVTVAVRMSSAGSGGGGAVAGRLECRGLRRPVEHSCHLSLVRVLSPPRGPPRVRRFPHGCKSSSPLLPLFPKLPPAHFLPARHSTRDFCDSLAS